MFRTRNNSWIFEHWRIFNKIWVVLMFLNATLYTGKDSSLYTRWSILTRTTPRTNGSAKQVQGYFVIIRVNAHQVCAIFYMTRVFSSIQSWWIILLSSNRILPLEKNWFAPWEFWGRGRLWYISTSLKYYSSNSRETKKNQYYTLSIYWG